MAALVNPITPAQHGLAVLMSKAYITDFSDLPPKPTKVAMFRAAPPSQLNHVDGLKYNHQYTRLVEGICAPVGTTRGLSTDKAANARKELWRLWYKAQGMVQVIQVDDEEEGDYEDSEYEVANSDNGEDGPEFPFYEEDSDSAELTFNDIVGRTYKEVDMQDNSAEHGFGQMVHNGFAVKNLGGLSAVNMAPTSFGFTAVNAGGYGVANTSGFTPVNPGGLTPVNYAPSNYGFTAVNADKYASALLPPNYAPTGYGFDAINGGGYGAVSPDGPTPEENAPSSSLFTATDAGGYSPVNTGGDSPSSTGGFSPMSPGTAASMAASALLEMGTSAIDEDAPVLHEGNLSGKAHTWEYDAQGWFRLYRNGNCVYEEHVRPVDSFE